MPGCASMDKICRRRRFPFFCSDTTTTEIYTLSLHDALPISGSGRTTGRTGSIAVGVTEATSRAVVRARRLAEREGVDAAGAELSTAAADRETPALAVVRVQIGRAHV